MMPFNVSCGECGAPYPLDEVLYRCPTCGGLYDYTGTFPFDKKSIDRTQPGIWRYRNAFEFPENLEPVSLGEGNTPVVWARAFGRSIAFKCEFLNPSGSFKDRGSALIAAWMRWHGVNEVVEDSSGNAGASIAAYSARAGIKAHVFVPESSSGPKRRQIEAYGAELVPIPGSRSDVARAVERQADAGSVYASHSFLPFNLPGYATVAYEVMEQLGQLPGTVITPAGQGGLLLGLARGFNAIRIGNNFVAGPRLIGVQAQACAPLWAHFKNKKNSSDIIDSISTIAEGVRVSDPLRKKAVLAVVQASGGTIFATEEQDILQGQSALAVKGFYVEPTSAIVWSALEHLIDGLPDTIVVILTGSGLKYG
jgi:threonine synthase